MTTGYERVNDVAGVNPHGWAEFRGFDPGQGSVVREPPGSGPGFWAGAPGVCWDSESERFYLAYRLRRPRGIEPDRGYEVRIAGSQDGVTFTDIWAGLKQTLGSTSIERCCLIRLPDDTWGLLVSYVDPADARWRIDLTTAARPEKLRLEECRPVLLSAEIGAEGVKDPFVFRVAGLYHMYVSFATAEENTPASDLHSTHDAYNTGLIKSRSGLATSDDGRAWTWEGEVFGPSQSGWDRYCARIAAVWPEQGVWLALYDGSADVSENYEERCGLAYSLDLRTFHRVSRSGPFMTADRAGGALRYFDVVQTPAGTLFYYEAARSDGSHELRVWKRTNESASI